MVRRPVMPVPERREMSVETLITGLLLVGVGGWGVLVIRRYPVVATVGFLAVVMFVPAWLTISYGVEWAPTMIVGLAIVIGMFGTSTVRPVAFDIVLLGFGAVGVIAELLGIITSNSLYWLLLWWALPYLVGRTLGSVGQAQAVYDTVAVLIAVVAVLAVIESMTNYNIFDALLGHGSTWAQLQYRGGRVRAEGAFGHSIALGAVLGMSVPMVWSSRWRPWARLSVIALVSVAALLTFSRIGMLTTMLALAASFLLLRQEMSARVRWAILGAGAVVAAVLVPTVMNVFDDAGTEATQSADYRTFLLTLLPKLSLFGQATSPAVDLSSIDSEPLLFGVRYGLVPLVLILVCALVGVVVAIRRPNPGLVSIAAMLPGLTSVAFLLQFTAFFWFAAGIGVSVLVGHGSPGPDPGRRALHGDETAPQTAAAGVRAAGPPG